MNLSPDPRILEDMTVSDLLTWQVVGGSDGVGPLQMRSRYGSEPMSNIVSAICVRSICQSSQVICLYASHSSDMGEAWILKLADYTPTSLDTQT